MGSLTPSGQPITKATNVLRHSHNGNYVRQSNTSLDTKSTISNSGVTSLANLGQPFGVEFQPAGSRSLISGVPLIRRELSLNPLASGIVDLEFNKFANDSGNLQHVVTRAMGLHTSVQDRESPNSSLGPMTARTERKVFSTAWTIFDGSGNPVGTATGTTDTDVSPAPTYDS